MVGQKQDRLAGMGHLDRASFRPLRGQFARVLAHQRVAGEPDADARGLRRHLPVLGEQQRHRGVREPVGAGAERDGQRDRLARSGQRRAQGGLAVDRERGGVGEADRRACAERVRADPRERVGRG